MTDQLSRPTPQFCWVGNFDTVCEPADLERKPGIHINPPPAGGRCECCGRHISELTPFGGPGDPLVGDFSGALLVKKYRALGPYEEEADMAVGEAEKAVNTVLEEDLESVEQWLVEKYGYDKGRRFLGLHLDSGCIGSSWECRDCAVLHQEEYSERRKVG